MDVVKRNTIRVTLAQRLDELSAANSNGLLKWVFILVLAKSLNLNYFECSDDEYRLLRQNLFERFASKSEVPTEASVVPAAATRPSSKNGRQTLERRKFSLSSVWGILPLLKIQQPIRVMYQISNLTHFDLLQEIRECQPRLV